MRFRVRQLVWVIGLALTVTVFGAPPLAQAHQQWPGTNGGRDSRIVNNPQYQRGMQQAQDDREHRRARAYHMFGLRNEEDKRAYREGYDHGWDTWADRRNDHDRDRDRDRDRGRDRDRDRDRFERERHPGFRMGFTDGRTDGERDRSLNRQFKYGPGWNHPDRGYNASYGDKGAYQQQYRQGYQEGYKEGYGHR